MRITEITIKMEPNEKEMELGQVPRTIKRLADKQWVIQTDGDKLGFFSYEMQIATNMQTQVINQYHSQVKE